MFRDAASSVRRVGLLVLAGATVVAGISIVMTNRPAGDPKSVIDPSLGFVSEDSRLFQSLRDDIVQSGNICVQVKRVYLAQVVPGATTYDVDCGRESYAVGLVSGTLTAHPRSVTDCRRIEASGGHCFQPR